jgi:hypothetical protein
MSPECQKFAEDLAAYVEDTLPQEERTSMESHLEACPDCRQRVEQEKRLTASLRAIPDEHPPAEEMWGVIRDRLDRNPRLIPVWWAAAASVVVILASWLVLGRSVRSSEAAIDVNSFVARLQDGADAAEEAFVKQFQARPVENPSTANIPGLRFEFDLPMPANLQLASLREFDSNAQKMVFARFEGGGKDMFVIKSERPVTFRCDSAYCTGCDGGECRCPVMPMGQWRVVRVSNQQGCYCIAAKMEGEELRQCMAVLGVGADESGRPAE